MPRNIFALTFTFVFAFPFGQEDGSALWALAVMHREKAEITSKKQITYHILHYVLVVSNYRTSLAGSELVTLEVRNNKELLCTWK